ncbi:hypothetical protein ALC57_06024, partial [Trachymyrmex cornetzi]
QNEDQEQEHQQQEQRCRQHEVNNFNYIDLRAENSRQFRNFAILGREATFAIRPPPEGSDIAQWLENAFREIRTYAVHSCEPSDYIGLSFESADLARGPAGLSFRPARDLTHKDIWGLVNSLVHSAGGIDIAENFTVRVFRVSLPAGRGRQSNRLTREDVAKRSILQIANCDNLCFPRLLVAARVHYDRGQLRVEELHERWEFVRQQRSSLQRELAKELTISAGVTIPEEGCGIREIEQFQRFLAAENIAIVVYNFSTFGRGENPLYDDCALLSFLGRESSFRLNIMYYERSRHYQPILNMKAAAVMEKWKCDFDREIRENNEMRDFLENAQIIKNSPLDPRDAFFGGRTGNIATRCDVAGMEKIHYIDVCSLYPYVLKMGAFPIGHPKIYIGEECSELIGVAPDFDFNSLEGLIRCKVLPPRDLFHRVLPYPVRGKLLFALCRSCCETFSQAECTHSLTERKFEGWIVIDRRMEFCEEIEERGNDFVSKIIFTGEAAFQINGNVNHQNFRYWSTENPHWMRADKTQYLAKVNVWAGIIGEHLIGPFFFAENLNAEAYEIMLIQQIIPAIRNLYPNDEFNQLWFQHDGAPAHFALRVRRVLDEYFPH